MQRRTDRSTELVRVLPVVAVGFSAALPGTAISVLVAPEGSYIRHCLTVLFGVQCLVLVCILLYNYSLEDKS